MKKTILPPQPSGKTYYYKEGKGFGEHTADNGLEWNNYRENEEETKELQMKDEGVLGLLEKREKLTAILLEAGYNQRQIGDLLEIDQSSVSRLIKKVREKLSKTHKT